MGSIATNKPLEKNPGSVLSEFALLKHTAVPNNAVLVTNVNYFSGKVSFFKHRRYTQEKTHLAILHH
jgi:hypothetical protein